MTDIELLTIPLLDEGTIQAMSDDVGSDICWQLTHVFIRELQQLLQKIRIATEQQQTLDIIDAVHILKNSAALYGASRLAFISNELHEAPLLTPTQRLQLTDNLIEIGHQTLLLYQDRFAEPAIRNNLHE